MIDPQTGYALNDERDHESPACQVLGHCYTRDLPNGSWEYVTECLDCGEPLNGTVIRFEDLGEIPF